MKFLLAMAPTILLVVYGQLVTKWRVAFVLRENTPSGGRLEKLLQYLTDPYILSAYGCVFLSSIAWMFVVERYPLSQSFPVYIGITFCLVTLGSAIIFGENITTLRWISIALIGFGVALGSQA